MTTMMIIMTTVWDVVIKFMELFFRFLNGRNFIILLAALAVWAGIFKFDEIKSLIETVFSR